jgi:hypothetical protein
MDRNGRRITISGSNLVVERSSRWHLPTHPKCNPGMKQQLQHGDVKGSCNVRLPDRGRVPATFTRSPLPKLWSASTSPSLSFAHTEYGIPVLWASPVDSSICGSQNLDIPSPAISRFQLLNIAAAVGYDTETLYSESFENPQRLWYEKFSFTKSFFPFILIYSVHYKRGDCILQYICIHRRPGFCYMARGQGGRCNFSKYNCTEK